MNSSNCHQCQTPFEWSAQNPVGRRDSCAKCGADLHACLNCRHYDKTSYRECRETISEAVREKDRSNFCDFYSPRDASAGSSTASSSADDLLKKAEALFKK